MSQIVSTRAPLYLTPPCSPATRQLIRSGHLGMIDTPAQGNQIERDFPFFCVDNGIFGGKYPGDARFLRYLDRLRPHAERCLFVVAPDRVADHFGTWADSAEMLPLIRQTGLPAALVAQDGMEHEPRYLWDDFDALFIGGSTEWKLGPEAAELIRVAIDMGKWVHMGRVNSLRRFLYAADLGVHSVDGTYLTYGPDQNLPKVMSWITAAGSTRRQT